MRKFAILAAALVAGVAAPAVAQDDDNSGASFHVGAIGGYDVVKLGAGGASESDSGIMYGAVAGVDFNIGSGMFLGLEGEFTDSEVGETYEDVLTAGDEASLSAGSSFFLGGRVGVPISSGGSKVYAKGGYASVKMNVAYDDGIDVLEGSETLGGFLVGGGVDIKVAPVVVRVEYRYSDFGEIDILGTSTGISASRHQVVAGLLFDF